MTYYPWTQRYMVQLIFAFALAAITVDAFSGTFTPSSVAGRPPHTTTAAAAAAQRLHRLQAHDASGDENNSRHLLSLVSTDDDDGENERDEDQIKDEIASLESSFRSSDSSSDNRFDPLIGLYEVKAVLTSNKKDNPVGGKWTRSNGLAQKLFQTRATFQHLLPFNATGLSLSSENAVAEAINVVSLDALDGLFRATVILRGDAVPLSSEELQQLNTNRTITPLTNLAVRAFFDPPRIYFGKRKKGNRYSYLPLIIGPKSSVTLDTTYYDKMVRVGMGGTSGTRFVFTATAAEEAKEYEALLSQQSGNNKRKVLATMGGILAASLYVAFGSVGADRLGIFASKLVSAIANAKITATTLSFMARIRPLARTGTRIIAAMTSVISGIAMLLILFSSGGIERDGMSRSPSP
ncbi:hypothetical protein ACHAXR_011866 [Thalassiosira sp. AJA248-18]